MGAMIVFHSVLLVALFLATRHGMQYLVLLKDGKRLYYTLNVLQALTLAGLLHSLTGILTETIASVGKFTPLPRASWAPYYALSSFFGFASGKRKLIEEHVLMILGSDAYANLELIRGFNAVTQPRDRLLRAVLYAPITILVCLYFVWMWFYYLDNRFRFSVHPALICFILWVQYSFLQDHDRSHLFARIGKFRRHLSNEEIDALVKDDKTKHLNNYGSIVWIFESKKARNKFLAVRRGKRRSSYEKEQRNSEMTINK
jgi:hypothetical protein